METQATNATPSTSQALIKSNKKVNSLVLGYSTYSSHTLINSKKEVNSLVFDYLVRLSHLEIAHDFIELVGPLEDVKDGPILEEILTDYNINTDEDKYSQITNHNIFTA